LTNFLWFATIITEPENRRFLPAL